jgi:hypothetical protein
MAEYGEEVPMRAEANAAAAAAEEDDPFNPHGQRWREDGEVTEDGVLIQRRLISGNRWTILCCCGQ